MKVSVVVPAFNEEGGLGAALGSIRASLAAFDGLGWTHELIVCDNNSTDATAAIARAAGASVVFEPVNQIGRARNTGAAGATGEWLVFVDADSYPTRELFAEVARQISAGRCLAGGSTVRFESRHRAPAVMGWMWNMTSRVNRWGAGSFIFCETAAFRDLGGFNQELYASEEIDFFRRAKRLARRRRRSIVIVHAHPLLTSDRKAHLYSWREMLVFMIKTVTRRGRTLRNPDDCFAWYDGRR